jgi:hypothetical protein
MADGPGESAPFSAPPPDGLGNYKGVMLCNRPVDEAPAKIRNAMDSNLPPFKSTIHPLEREQLGLVPTKKLEPRDANVKTRGPSAALRRHMQWIKELQVQVADEQQRIVDDGAQDANRKQRMQVLFKQQRDAIRDLKHKKGDDVEARELMDLMTGAKAKSTAAKTKARKSDRKPLWAMTEEEKAGVEDEEAAALIDFAADLDFEKYCGDAEFRSCLQVIQDRAKKLEKEQNRFKDDLIRDFNAQVDDEDEGFSAYTGSPRNSQIGDTASRLGDLPGRTGPARRSDQPEWDSSTTCGDDRPEMDKDNRSDAGRVLDSMPQLKGIHSKESMQRIIEKTRGSTPQVA